MRAGMTLVGWRPKFQSAVWPVLTLGVLVGIREAGLEFVGGVEEVEGCRPAWKAGVPEELAGTANVLKVVCSPRQTLRMASSAAATCFGSRRCLKDLSLAF